jgi:hypothetical protein
MLLCTAAMAGFEGFKSPFLCLLTSTPDTASFLAPLRHAHQILKGAHKVLMRLPNELVAASQELCVISCFSFSCFHEHCVWHNERNDAREVTLRSGDSRKGRGPTNRS